MSAASTALTIASVASTDRRIVRRFRMSVKAPDGRASNKIGRSDAVCTNDTITGDGDMDVMSHPLVTSNSQVQMFSVNNAIQSSRKTVSESGLQSDAVAVGAATVVGADDEVTRGQLLTGIILTSISSRRSTSDSY